jgi:large subunit ribosomal protein L11
MENSSTKRKKIACIRMTLLANRAAPSPLLGQALGQYGLNIAGFCKSFNEKTKNIKEHVYIPTRVEVYRLHGVISFEITTKSPSSTYLLKQTANLLKGSPFPGRPLATDGSTKRTRIWSVSLREIYHLALLVRCNGVNTPALCKTLIGSAKSIGLCIVHP